MTKKRTSNHIDSLKYSRKKSTLTAIMKYKEVYLLMLPAMLYYIIFCYVPMFGIVIAFEDYSVTKGFFGSPFVGLENFRLFLTNYKFWQLLRNTLLISVYSLIFSFPAPIILALLLNEVHNNKFKRAVQTITYMPHFISVVIVSSMILSFVASDGFINSLRTTLGAEGIQFMTQPKYFRSIYILSGIWQEVGWSSIIYMAALTGIDIQLYEAARIDGAGRWKQLMHITLPSILPTIMILFIMRMGQMLTVGYEKIMLLYNPSIYETADVISTYVYRSGLLDGNYSYSAAVGMFNSVINLILLLSSNTIAKKLTDSGLW